mgnify:CR=1 FL=1
MKSTAGTIAPLLVSTVLFAPVAVQAQVPIIHASDGTNTAIHSEGNAFNITGGTQTGSNLFHSFQQFGLNQGQVANFLSNSTIQNILGRVTGGDVSVIDGRIQVTGSNANLYLMNPAGIVFGANASLNVPGSFIATTANGIRFSNGWFNAVGDNNYAVLVGNPDSYGFVGSQLGVIINAGNLAVRQGQSLTLLGGTVINTGTLDAPNGAVTIAAVPGEKLVRVSQVGSLLSLEFQPLLADIPQAGAPPLTLPQLLTGGNLSNASGLTIENGVVKLTGSGIAVVAGDVVAKNIAAQTMLLSADNNLTLVESQLRANGNLSLLANQTVTVRDSLLNPVVVQAGGDLTIQGNQGIDILALNHSTPAFQSMGTLNLISDGIISGDAHYTSGNFSIRRLDGTPGPFLSLYDPIISANGDVIFGDYTGASLKVETTGNITTGNIQITQRDSTFATAPEGSDRRLLSDYPTLILRAGVSVLEENREPNPSSTPPFTTTNGTTFSGSAPSATTGRVTVGTPGNPSLPSIRADYVDISAPNGILINAPISASYVKLTSASGDVVIHSVSTTAKLGDTSTFDLMGNIDITAGGLFRAIGILEGITDEERPVSISVVGTYRETSFFNFDILNGSVIIRYADRSRTILSSPYIEILGDGNQPFVIGPDSSPSFAPVILSEGVSGTSGSIRISYYSIPFSVDGNLVFPRVLPDRAFSRNLPVQEISPPPPEVVLSPSPELNTTIDSGPSPNSTSPDAQTVQRQLNGQIQAVGCYSASLVSDNLAGDPCVQAIQDEQQILKILDEPADPEQSKALMEMRSLRDR